jgi:AmmeMemoRadiSam system protein B
MGEIDDDCAGRKGYTIEEVKNIRGESIRALFVAVLCAVFIFSAPCCGRQKKQNGHDESPAEETHSAARVQEMTGGVFREPAAAGSFYPADPVELRRTVRTLLQEAQEDPGRLWLDGRPIVLLVPHAGYVFSGKTAAFGFVTLEGTDYERVVLIGPPHRVAVRGASVYCGDGFSTPLGTVPVDTAFTGALVSSSNLITGDETPHREEHSIEVQLPFLQEVLGTFSIVPILVMGDQTVLDVVARALLRTAVHIPGGSGRTLWVISTDLSHYPEKKAALACDAEILEAFCSLDCATLMRADRELMQRGVKNLVCTMCGIGAAYIGIRVARAYSAESAVVLHRSVSADAQVEGVGENRVVGYAAVAVLGGAESVGFPVTTCETRIIHEREMK